MDEKKGLKKRQRLRLIITLITLAVILVGMIVICNKVMNGKTAEELSRIVWLVGGMATLVILLLVSKIMVTYYQRGSSREQESLFDTLTGLPNWKNLEGSVKTLPYAINEYACFVFSINNFKRINTLFGFEEGGQVLKSVAQILEHELKEGEQACRISGDKFALMLHYTNQDDLTQRINQIFKDLECLDGQADKISFVYNCTYTGGVCLMADLEPDQTIVDARDQGFLVLQDCKQGATTAWNYFDEGAKQELLLRQSLEADLVKAFLDREFVPYFQPNYNSITGEIFGAEVLARWNHPHRGVIMPRHFIPVLEQSGCILDLDLCMLEGACGCLKNWISQGHLPVTLTVNISRLNLHRKDFVSQVCTVVNNYGVPANLLAFEIEDKTFADDLETVLGVIQALKAYGFKIIMDDEGSGAVTIEVFQRIALDYIKVNKNFIIDAQKNVREQCVFSSLLQMTKSIGIVVIAKYVETKEEVDIITGQGCENLQGRFFTEPLPEATFVRLLFETGK